MELGQDLNKLRGRAEEGVKEVRRFRSDEAGCVLVGEFAAGVGVLAGGALALNGVVEVHQAVTYPEKFDKPMLLYEGLKDFIGGVGIGAGSAAAGIAIDMEKRAESKDSS